MIGVAHFVECLRMRHFVVENLNDVEAVLGLHQIRNAALGQGKSGLLEFGHRLAFDDPAEIAALGFRGVVFRIFLREIFKIRAVLRLLQNVLGLLVNFGDFRVRLADGLEENVLGVDAILDFVLSMWSL